MFKDIVSFYSQMVDSVNLTTISKNEIENYKLQHDLLSKRAVVTRDAEYFIISPHAKEDTAEIANFIQKMGFFESLTLSKNSIRFKCKKFTQDIIDSRRAFFSYIITSFDLSLRNKRTSLLNSERQLDNNKENFNKIKTKIDTEFQRASAEFKDYFNKKIFVRNVS